MSGLSVGVCLIGKVMWVDCFVVVEQDFLGKMVGADMVIDVVAEVVVVEIADMVRALFFVFSSRGCLGNMMGASVVIEVVVGVVVLVWRRWSLVWDWV